MRRPTAVLVVTLVAALLGAGCGGSSDADQVRQTLATFARATARKDYQTLCDRVLAASLTEKLSLVGLPCEVALGKYLGAAVNPTLTVRSVTVDGNRATAFVHATEAGQPPSDETVRLVKERGSWRVSALAAPRPRRRAPAAGIGAGCPGRGAQVGIA